MIAHFTERGFYIYCMFANRIECTFRYVQSSYGRGRRLSRSKLFMYQRWQKMALWHHWRCDRQWFATI